MQLLRTVTPSRRIAPMPTSDPSLTVAAWMVAPCPAHEARTTSSAGQDLGAQSKHTKVVASSTPRTYGDVVAYRGWRLLPLRVMPRNVYHRPVLYVGIGANADGIHVSCASPAGQGWCACLPGRKAPQRGHLPRKMAPYHTDEPLPSVTSPMTLAFGATKASGASVGRFPLYSCSVWCAATARTTPHVRGPGVECFGLVEAG